MATVYMELENDDKRDSFLRIIADIEDDELAAKFIDRVKNPEKGRMHRVDWNTEAKTDIEKLEHSLAQHGVQGFMYQGSFKKQNGSWLAIKLRTKRHLKKLKKELEKIRGVNVE